MAWLSRMGCTRAIVAPRAELQRAAAARTADAITAGGAPDPEKMGELCARYALDMQPDSLPELCARFGLWFPGVE